MNITITDVVSILKKIIDISLVWMIFYYMLKHIKNNVKLSLIFKGVFLVIILNIRISVRIHERSSTFLLAKWKILKTFFSCCMDLSTILFYFLL